MKNIESPVIIKQILGYCLILLGIYLIYDVAIIFGLPVLGYGMAMISRKGSEIKLAEKKYRIFLSILGIEFGFWKKLPKIDYISVFKTLQKKRMRGIMMAPIGTPNETTYTEVVFKLLLFYERNKKIELLIVDNEEKAFKEAFFMSDYLDVKILDATKRPSVWI